MPTSLNSTASRGLANRARTTLEAQGARFHSKLLGLLQRDTSTKKALRRLVEKVQRAGEAARLIQVIGQTLNGRDVVTSHFVPESAPKGENCAHQGLRYCLVQLAFSTRRRTTVGPDFGVVVEIREHALERLFLRLNTLSLAAVADELRDAMLLTLPLTEVARRLNLRQLALPTSSGAFLCRYEPLNTRLSGMTWLSKPQYEENARWGKLCSILKEANDDCGGDRELAMLLGSGMKQNISEGNCRLVEKLTSVLSPLAWVRRPYEPRPDMHGEQWAAARVQSAERSAAPSGD